MKRTNKRNPLAQNGAKAHSGILFTASRLLLEEEFPSKHFESEDANNNYLCSLWFNQFISL